MQQVLTSSTINSVMEPTSKPRNIPTSFIIFGATGDLMALKLIPALFHLYTQGMLPKLFRIIGFSRRNLSQEEFQNQVGLILRNHKQHGTKKEDIENFLRLLVYQQGDFDQNTSYVQLAEYLGRVDGEWKCCSNKLFYLAVPPQHYKDIFINLHDSGLTIPCSPEEGWTRVIVEKPFGNDLKTAEELDTLLSKLFREEQLFRIDHYLAKEMLQNILSFRFSNDIFEKTWGAETIEKIEITALENIGIDGRGTFYDGIGALRDYGQNHLLQMLALITMKQPKSLTASDVRKERGSVLKKLKKLSSDEIKNNTFRGQYEGYKNEEGVSPNSKTETYFKVKFQLSDSNWKNVPIIIESGKKLQRKKEIVVTFKHTIPCLCPTHMHYKNRLVFSLEPKEAITMYFWAKKPGLSYEMEEQKLSFLFRDARKRKQYIEEYEKLLLDCILGNQLLFVSSDEVKAMWEFVDPIVHAWEKNEVKLISYKPFTKNVLQEARIIEN